MSLGWYISIFAGWLIVLAFYLYTAFRRIDDLEKRIDKLEYRNRLCGESIRTLPLARLAAHFP